MFNFWTMDPGSNAILKKIVEHARLGLPLPGHGLDPSETIRLAVERGISIPAARRLLRKTAERSRKKENAA